MAGLLWDLIDPVDADDATIMVDAKGRLVDYADCIQMDPTTLWQILQQDYTGQVDGPPAAKLAKYGYISDIKQLYDVLKKAGYGWAKTAIGATRTWKSCSSRTASLPTSIR